MLRPHRLLPAAGLILALALSACAQGARTPASGSQAARPAPAPASGLAEQAAWLKGSAAKLAPIPGASAWLGAGGLQAYRDVAGAECVYDGGRDTMLSWEPDLRTVTSTNDTWQPEGYGVSVGAAAAKADIAARKVHKGDVAAMRRTVQLDDKGDGPLYVFQYDRYVNGVRIPDHVTVDCSGATGEAGFTAFFTKPAGAAETFSPKLTLPDAVAKAAAALKLTSWRFVSAELYLEPMSGSTAPKVVWAIAVSPLKDGAAGVALVDPLTGETSVPE